MTGWIDEKRRTFNNLDQELKIKKNKKKGSNERVYLLFNEEENPNFYS